MTPALRSSSRLLCSVPDAAVVNPGSSNITHEPFSSSDTERDRVGLSVVTLNSLPARTLVVPPTGKSLPLRVRTATGVGGSPMRPVLAPTTGPPRPRPPAGAPCAPPPPPGPPGAPAAAAAGAAPRPPGAPAAGAAPRPPGAPAPGAPPRPPPPPAPTVIRPTSPLHTAAFHVGLTSHPSSSAIPPLMTMKELGTPPTEPSLSWNTDVL